MRYAKSGADKKVNKKIIKFPKRSNLPAELILFKVFSFSIIQFTIITL
tara:strand:+ start:1403 stop:1546 length:144 start_codon:yes stop_codon:yes gene_type:complete